MEDVKKNDGRRHRDLGLCLSVAGWLLAACGGGGSSSTPRFGPETAPEHDAQSAITAAETDLIQLATVDASSGGPELGFAALDLALSLPLVITPDSGATLVQARTGSAAVGSRALAVLKALPRASADPCVVVSSNRIVFDHCMREEITIDGAISWGAGRVDVDIHGSAATDDGTADVTIAIALQVSASAITGEVTVEVEANRATEHLAETAQSSIDVQIDQGCISGGTITVTATGSGTGSVNGAVQVVWRGCHVARVRHGTSA